MIYIKTESIWLLNASLHLVCTLGSENVSYSSILCLRGWGQIISFTFFPYSKSIA